MNYVEKCLNEVIYSWQIQHWIDNNDIDDWIENWHYYDIGIITDISLDEYLGFTYEEAQLWSSHPEKLKSILEKRFNEK